MAFEENRDLACSNSSCGCSDEQTKNGLQRRDFLKLVGAVSAAAVVKPWEAMAGPFTRADFEQLVPADKKLRPKWVTSLTVSGGRTIHSLRNAIEMRTIAAPNANAPSIGCSKKITAI